MTIDRAQQDYELESGAIATIYRTVPRRGRRSRVHVTLVRADATPVDEPENGFATWDEAEAWMRKEGA